MTEDTLFRSEARLPTHRSNVGEILLIHPISYTFLTVFACATAVAIVLFLVIGAYTKRVTATGQLVPDLGLIKIYAPQLGVIVEKHVTEGQKVRRGDVLYVVTSERQSVAFGDTQAGISAQAQLRVRTFREQIEQAKVIAAAEVRMARGKLAQLGDERASVEELLAGLRKRSQLAEEKQARYDELRESGYVSKEQYLAAQVDALDQHSRLKELERQRIILNNSIEEQILLLGSLPAKHAAALAEYERGIAAAERELTESETQRRWVVSAPESGTVTAVVGEVGQTIDETRPLLAVVPSGARLQAHLYAPSSAVGFVKPGDQVYVRFRAYPYQKFGHHRGRVLTVAAATASPSELIGASGAAAVFSKEEPLYRIAVELHSQEMLAYGLKRPLQSGMLVDADILQDTRRLYEWVLEPLYAVSGSLH